MFLASEQPERSKNNDNNIHILIYIQMKLQWRQIIEDIDKPPDCLRPQSMQIINLDSKFQHTQ